MARPTDTWGPQYFLASVGAGGLAVSFFLWLYMWVPHPGQQVPVFEDIASAWGKGDPLQMIMIAVAMTAIAAAAFVNLKLLIWNLGRFSSFRLTPAYDRLRQTNGEAQLTALPLAIAMAINVGFVLGLVFVPGLWGVVEYLFPLAIAAFLVTGLLALAQLGTFYGRVFGTGGFDWAGNNSFSQVMPAFALGMVGVGLSASAAMSANPVTAGAAIVLAVVFLVISALIAMLAVVLGLVSMAQHGTSVEGAPSLTIIVPLMTVLGILTLRVTHGMGAHFDAHAAPGDYLWMLSAFLGVQIAFLLFGVAVLRAQGYLGRFVTGPEVSAGSFGLVCPGVALAVMLQFFINKGLVGAGLIDKFGTAYWALSALSVAAQMSAVWIVLVLYRKHFRPDRSVPATAAE
ncbi:hypothetical protein GEU84_014820 [Fertoebacter nigrum]|uniref:Uncharacterized protein n=1 Tax=Fertoeibacter niger TaxID=2656921 RepID=A0A8X8GWI1_9RHOB|nr:hypothetical protein [Fertoeibacter niger]NUB45669.1 hypothetical protein [Fertoeibacter niger]